MKEKSMTAKTKKFSIVRVALLGWMVLGCASWANLVTFKQGSTNILSGGSAYAGTEDTYLNGATAAVKDYNYGSAEYLPFGLSGDRKALVRFDVSGLNGLYSSIESVTLRLRASNAATANVWQVSSANADWVEGNQDNAVSTGGASYNFKSTSGGVPSDWAGGVGMKVADTDYVSSSMKQASVAGAGEWFEFTWTGAEAKALIDSWASTTMNGGWLVDLDGDSGQSGLVNVNFSSSESANAPELVVNFTAIPEPTTIALFGISALSIILLERKQNEALRIQDEVETRL
jgi:hypothetical protein